MEILAKEKGSHKGAEGLVVPMTSAALAFETVRMRCHKFDANMADDHDHVMLSAVLSLCVHHSHAKSFDAIVVGIGADLFVSIVNRHAM